MRSKEFAVSAQRRTIMGKRAWEVVLVCGCGEEVSGLASELDDAFTVAKLSMDAHHHDYEELGL